jgi:type III secretion system YscQ/HrcQ family protein
VTPEIVPFPFASLETLTRNETRAATRLLRVGRAHLRVDALGSALSELLGERVELSLLRARATEAPRGADDRVGVLLTAADGRDDAARRVLVEMEGALATTLVARVLQRRAPRITDTSRATSPEIAGAAAGVLASALRRAHAGRAPRIVAAGPGFALARDLLSGAGPATTAWLTVVVGAAAFAARITVPDAADQGVADAPLSPAHLAEMGEMPLALPLVCATALVSRGDIRALAPGDALLVPELPLDHATGDLIGPAALVAPRGERGLACDLAAGGRLVLRGLVERHPWDPPMTTETSPTTEVLDDAPVVVRVELGAVEMTAREWANLAPGDVVSLRRRIGDPAALRIGGALVARGELVLVDGEVGVRIVSREAPRHMETE